MNRIQTYLPVIGAAIRIIVVFITVLSIPLAASMVLSLSPVETSSWILSLYGLSALLSLTFTIIYRQPILFTGNIFFVIFINGLEGQLSYPELIGASIVAGAAVTIIALMGLTRRLTDFIPFPIMFGLLAGAVFPFVSNIFRTVDQAPLLIIASFVVYLLSRRFLGNRIPAILPALITGILMAAITGQINVLSGQLTLTYPKITFPVFSLPAIITATPVLFVLITLQGNIPSLRFLQSQKYNPPEFVVSIISGVGTMIGSLFGPTGISLSLPATSLVAGAEAGEFDKRHLSVYMVCCAGILIGLLAGIAVDIASILPFVLLLTLAGISVVDVLGTSLKRLTEGPLFLGPLFAFIVAMSDISFLGFGPFFWSPAIGTGISLLLEREEMRMLRERNE
jgi:benzoate membrane transport protein